MTHRSLLAALGAALSLIVAATVAASTGRSAPAATSAALTQKAILFASDGMRPDLMEKYAGQGLMPTYTDLMSTGVRGANGLLQAFPPNTGVGWHTLATGSWPASHGSMNNTYFRVGEGNFNNRTSFATDAVLQSDHIAQAADFPKAGGGPTGIPGGTGSPPALPPGDSS